MIRWKRDDWDGGGHWEGPCEEIAAQMDYEESLNPEPEDQMEPKSKRLIESMRQVADFLEENPEIEILGDVDLFPVTNTKAELIAVARKHGPLKKVWYDPYFSLEKEIGQITLNFMVPREQVCKMVTTKKTIHVPATEAHEEEVVERTWICDEPILQTEASNGRE